jgi:transcriptional regulator GlxA family with amidase domain
MMIRMNVRKIDVARYVADCLRREDPPRASELAMFYGVTLSHLSRTFRARYGVTLSEFIKRLQVRRAELLLRNTKLDTTHVGYACGFGTRRSFFRAYRRFKGDSPRHNQVRRSTRRG